MTGEKPYIQSLWVSWTQKPIEEWKPVSNHTVNYVLEVTIGYKDSHGTEDCQITVLTEDSQRHFNMKRTSPKRCIIIPGEYQWRKVERAVQEKLNFCLKEPHIDIFETLSKHFKHLR